MTLSSFNCSYKVLISLEASAFFLSASCAFNLSAAALISVSFFKTSLNDWLCYKSFFSQAYSCSASFALSSPIFDSAVFWTSAICSLTFSEIFCWIFVTLSKVSIWIDFWAYFISSSLIYSAFFKLFVSPVSDYWNRSVWLF